MSVFRSAVVAARTSPPARRLRQAQLDRLRRSTLVRSPYFDAEWYRARYRDDLVGGLEPLDHFLAVGEAQNRHPGPDFDTDAYVWMNPVADGRALTHFHLALAAAHLDVGGIEPADVLDLTLPALTEGWLDVEWYRARHQRTGDADLDRLHPWNHYRLTGSDPSAFFDDTDYLARLPASERGRTALVHWMSEQDPTILPRVVRGTGAGDEFRPPLVAHHVRPHAELTGRRVAVMIHAYYLDLLEPILERVRAVRTTPTLLVSVVDAPAAATVHRLIDRMFGRAQPRTIKIAPNRGRNFAPLLCSFGAELRQHEFVLHLHTKQSLHWEGEHGGWREHLLRALLPSVAGVDAILSLLAGDEGVGVVHPPAYPGLATWSIHWLDNAARGAELFRRLGVDDRVADGHVSFPAGGMFWASVDALTPLLDLHLTVGDFEREYGQTDRTLAHAIERSIPAAAAVAGLDTVEFDIDTAEWRRNWTVADTRDVGHVDVADLEAHLAHADLVSVGLFDTLALRPTLQPSAASDATVPRTWLVERLATHRSARRPTDQPVRMVLITDSPSSGTAVASLLEQMGLGDVFDAVYTAGDTGCRKRTGELWELVREREARPDGHWVHIGHDEVADVQMPIERGIPAVYVPAPQAVARAAGVDGRTLDEPVRARTQQIAGHGLALLAATTHPPSDPELAAAHVGHAVLGPIVLTRAIGREGAPTAAWPDRLGTARRDLAETGWRELSECFGSAAPVIGRLCSTVEDGSSAARRLTTIAQDAAARFVDEHLERFGEPTGPADAPTVLAALRRTAGPLLGEIADALRPERSASAE